MELFARSEKRLLVIRENRNSIIYDDVPPIKFLKESENVNTSLPIEMENWGIHSHRELLCYFRSDLKVRSNFNVTYSTS
jgi:hypothetical protein